MPELPEVETVKNDLKPLLRDKKIKKIRIRLSKLVQMPDKLFCHLTENQVITNVRRRAKMLLIDLKNGQTVVIHLKMTGQLVFVSAKGKTQTGGHYILGGTEHLPNKYTHVIFELSKGSFLYFNDLRQFGYLLIKSTKELSDFFELKKLGPEPFDKSFTFQYFFDSLKRKKRSPIKLALLDQSILVGLGNIYVDESMFWSGIKPTRKVGSLNKEELKRLFQVIPKVLKKAIQKRGTTMRNYRDGLGREGGMLKYLKVYGREGKLCQRCKKAKIKRIRQGSRSTHYCPNCQK